MLINEKLQSFWAQSNPTHLYAKKKLQVGDLQLPLRKGRDSNPGYPQGYNGFRDRPDRPLRHLSNWSYLHAKEPIGLFASAKLRNIFGIHIKCTIFFCNIFSSRLYNRILFANFANQNKCRKQWQKSSVLAYLHRAVTLPA